MWEQVTLLLRCLRGQEVSAAPGLACWEIQAPVVSLHRCRGQQRGAGARPRPWHPEVLKIRAGSALGPQAGPCPLWCQRAHFEGKGQNQLARGTGSMALPTRPHVSIMALTCEPWTFLLWGKEEGGAQRPQTRGPRTSEWAVGSGLRPPQASSLQGVSLGILSGLCWPGWSSTGPDPNPGLCHVPRLAGLPSSQARPRAMSQQCCPKEQLFPSCPVVTPPGIGTRNQPGGVGDPEWRTSWRSTERTGGG